MLRMNKNKKSQAGFVITAELLLIVTVLVIGLVAGWTKVRDQTVAELNDTANAIGTIDQGYMVRGTIWAATGTIGATTGFQFDDNSDVATAPGGAIGGDAQLINYSVGLAPTVGSGGTFETSIF